MSSPRALVLLVFLALTVVAGRAQAMDLQRVADPAVCGEARCIVAQGIIVKEDVETLQMLVKEAGPGDLLVLNSEGGDLFSSLRLGNVIRGARLRTRVQAWDAKTARFRRGGVCASACAYAYLGGVERDLGAGARIGVRQIFSRSETLALSAQDGMELMSLVASHVNRLCGKLDILIPTMATPAESVQWLSSVELARYGVTTGPAQT